MGEGEAAARAHVAEDQAGAEDALGLLDGALALEGRVITPEVALQLVHQLGDRRKDGHLPHDRGEPFAAHGDVQVPFRVLTDRDLLGIEAVALQEGEVPQGQEIARIAHVIRLFRRADHFGHVVDLLPEQLVEAFRVAGAVAVEEGVFHLRAGI